MWGFCLLLRKVLDVVSPYSDAEGSTDPHKKIFGELRRAAVQRACCFLGILMTIDKEEMLCSMI